MTMIFPLPALTTIGKMTIIKKYRMKSWWWGCYIVINPSGTATDNRGRVWSRTEVPSMSDLEEYDESKHGVHNENVQVQKSN